MLHPYPLAAALTLVIAFQPGPGIPDATCRAYEGTVQDPILFTSAIQPYLRSGKKREFETTETFNLRREGVLEKAPRTLVIRKAPEDRKFFEYDADSQMLTILRWAFDNTRIETLGAVYSAGLHEELEVSTLGNIEVVIESRDESVGTYTASNAFGKEVEIVELVRITHAVFDRPGEFRRDGLFPGADDAPYVVGKLRLSIPEAKRLKPELSLAFVVQPKEPFIIEGEFQPYDVTVQNPKDVRVRFTILVADIQCGLLLDGTGQVLAAYTTR